MSDKLDMQIGIDYDDAGEREALQGLGRLQNMAKRDLAAEITRLNKARKEAAKLGDVDAYKKLDAQLKTAKKSLRELTQQSQIAKIATVQQAQAGMQFASTLGSLASGMKNGTASAADLANGVMSLGMAIKAGLGPIGLVMTAVQGLTMAWEWYATRQQKALHKEKERNDLINKTAEALRSLGHAMGEVHAQELKNKTDADNKSLDQKLSAQERALKKQSSLEKQQQEAREQIRQANADKEAADMRAKIARGEATEKELTELVRKNEKARAEAVATAGLQELSAQKQQTESSISETLQRIKTLKEQIGEAEKKYQDKWQKANSPELETAMKLLSAEREKTNLINVKLEKAKAKLDSFNLLDKTEALFDSTTRKKYSAAKAQVARLEEEQAQASSKLVAMKQELAAKYGNNFNEGMRNMGEAQALAAQKKELEDKLHVYQDQLKGLYDELDVIKEGVSLQEDVNDAQKQKLTAEQEAQAAREEQEKRQNDYAKLEGEAVENKLAYVQRVLAALKEGSEEYERWAKEARKLSNASSKEQLKDIADKFKTSGSYAKESAKTEAQALAADKRALLARRAALQKLLATPDLDASTQKEINDALAETNKEIRGFQAAMKQGAQQAQHELAHFKLPDLTPTSKSLQGNLKSTAAGMQMQAKRLEAAARKGDTKAMEQITRSMQRQASVLEAGTGYTQQYVALLEQAVANAQKILDSGDSRTEDQKNKDAVRQKTQANIRYAKALDKGAANAEKEAKGSTKKKSRDGEKQLDDANKKQAKEINKQTRQGKRDSKKNSPASPKQAPGTDDAATLQANAAALQAQIDSLKQLLTTATAQLGQMAPALAQLAPLITQMGSLVAQGNAATAAALAAARQEIARIRESLNRIRNR